MHMSSAGGDSVWGRLMNNWPIVWYLKKSIDKVATCQKSPAVETIQQRKEYVTMKKWKFGISIIELDLVEQIRIDKWFRLALEHPKCCYAKWLNDTILFQFWSRKKKNVFLFHNMKCNPIKFSANRESDQSFNRNNFDGSNVIIIPTNQWILYIFFWLIPPLITSHRKCKVFL